MERWSGRVALVTGASSGIGAALSSLLVKKGLQVVGVARKVEIIQQLAESLTDEPGKLYAVQADITKDEDIKAAFAWAETNLGGVDILVNNAGAECVNSLIDGPMENWQLLFNLNVLALSNCTKEALKSMRERGVDDGHIVHINSILGHYLPPIELPLFMYSASKHAVTVVTEGLRRELVKLNSKIRVTSVSPGLVKTKFFTEGGHSSLVADTIYQENSYLEAEDIANAVLYALGTPSHVQIHELTIKPVGEKF